jgi:hypothetical protein
MRKVDAGGRVGSRARARGAQLAWASSSRCGSARQRSLPTQTRTSAFAIAAAIISSVRSMRQDKSTAPPVMRRHQRRQGGSRIHLPNELDQPRAHIEPHVSALAPAPSDDPPDPAAAPGRASLAGILQPIRERIAAVGADANPGISLGHCRGDPRLGELVPAHDRPLSHGNPRSPRQAREQHQSTQARRWCSQAG